MQRRDNGKEDEQEDLVEEELEFVPRPVVDLGEAQLEHAYPREK